MWSDYEAAAALVGAEHLVVVCNYTGLQFAGRIDGWATLHGELMGAWARQRAARGWNTDYRTFVHADLLDGPPDAEVLAQGWYGTSGLYAAQAALERMGATAAILCGVPLDPAEGHIHTAGLWPAPERYQRGFHEAREAGAEIRSMGGWTAGVLGLPDADWLRRHGVAAPDMTALQRRLTPMRVRFLRDRNWTPPEERRITVAYKAGMELPVKRAWGEAMERAGDCEEIDPPSRVDDEPGSSLSADQIAALDHDGDGRAGGSLPKARRRGRVR